MNQHLLTQQKQLDLNHQRSRLFVSSCISIFLHFFIFLILQPGYQTQSATHKVRQITVQHLSVSLQSASHPVNTQQSHVEEMHLGNTPSRESTLPSKPAADSRVPSGLVGGPWYYPALYLHRHVTPLRPIWPTYPHDMLSISGRIRIRLLVNEEGKVDHYRIDASDLPKAFEDSVVQAFANETYAPGLIADTAVKGQLLVEVSFEQGQAPQAKTLLEELPLRSSH